MKKNAVKTPSKLLDGNLLDQELDTLAQMLEEMNDQEKGMTLSMADGFFSALAISPDLVMPSEWFGWVLNDMESLSDSDLQQLLTLLMRHYNSVQHKIRSENPPAFEPIYLYQENSEVPWVADWCHGFVTGVNVRNEAWSEALNTDEDAVLIELMVGMSTLPPPDEIDATFELADDVSQIFSEANKLAHEALYNYHQQVDPLAGWDALVGVSFLTLRDRLLHPELGSELCPCGSGKSFNRCCGAESRQLH